jgi:hypothetical protein
MSLQTPLLIKFLSSLIKIGLKLTQHRLTDISTQDLTQTPSILLHLVEHFCCQCDKPRTQRLITRKEGISNGTNRPNVQAHQDIHAQPPAIVADPHP